MSNDLVFLSILIPAAIIISYLMVNSEWLGFKARQKLERELWQERIDRWSNPCKCGACHKRGGE